MYEEDNKRDVFFYSSCIKQTLYESDNLTTPVLDADLEYLGADDMDILDLLTRAATKTSDLY